MRILISASSWWTRTWRFAFGYDTVLALLLAPRPLAQRPHPCVCRSNRSRATPIFMCLLWAKHPRSEPSRPFTLELMLCCFVVLCVHTQPTMDNYIWRAAKAEKEGDSVLIDPSHPQFSEVGRGSLVALTHRRSSVFSVDPFRRPTSTLASLATRNPRSLTSP